MLLDQNRYRTDHENLRNGLQSLSAESVTALDAFNSHSLAEQSAVDLPNRTDSKYLFPMAVLPQFLAEVRKEHTVLESDKHRIFTYENTYFDTSDWATYRAHHNGKLNRYKYRFRRYLETDTSYLEVKLKNNRDRTVKTRTRWKTDQPTEVLQDKLPVEPSLYVSYRRISLWNNP